MGGIHIRILYLSGAEHGCLSFVISNNVEMVLKPSIGFKVKAERGVSPQEYTQLRIERRGPAQEPARGEGMKPLLIKIMKNCNNRDRSPLFGRQVRKR
jgi:hypothetical protein